MIYVSLTTIPSRIRNLEKTIDSLISQKKHPDKIFINIPNSYKRFREKIKDNHIPKFKDKKIEIVRCDDYGPGTKLLGSIKKFTKNSLLILVDDDHYYEDYMIEKFYEYYLLAPQNAYSFYVHPIKHFGIGQGADGFAINTNFLSGVDNFYNEIVKNNNDLFLNDDLWISFFLFYMKKNKILSLQNHLKSKDNKIPLIYKIHTSDKGLISNYGNELKEAVKKRDKVLEESLSMMIEHYKIYN